MKDDNLHPDWETDTLQVSEPAFERQKQYRREALNDLQEVDREIAAIRRLRLEKRNK